MLLKPAIPFKISSIDSLGQGVSKEDGKVIFIHKTLPGDEGLAEVVAQRKGVSFGLMQSLTRSSADRIEAVCPHFASCPSCHYLHTSYEKELLYKANNLEKIFYKLPLPALKIIPAVKRLGYRNRIQLHYDTKKQVLGMLNVQQQRIIGVPSCMIGLPQVANEIKRLYQDRNWLKEAPKNVTQGHVEVYWINNTLQVNWNKPYAEGGFSQVFEEMNQLLKDELIQWQKDFNPSNLLDLFAGNGNLSSALNYSRRLCVDIYAETPAADFYSQHLYEADALNRIKSHLKKIDFRPSTLVLDPPRSGFKELNLWLDHFRPQHVAYVSCDPHTLKRDLQAVTNYTIKKVLLLDFFPSTYHFETLIFLERKP